MRAATIVLSVGILACFLVRRSDAVRCTSLGPDVPTGCTNCDLPANANHADCTTPTPPPPPSSTTPTTEDSIETDETGNGTGGRRRIVRVSNLRYTNVRRTPITNNSARRGNARRGNGRRGNGRRGNGRRGNGRRANVQRGNGANVRVIRI